jgi:ligand-binding sensor domain-containing protein
LICVVLLLPYNSIIQTKYFFEIKMRFKIIPILLLICEFAYAQQTQLQFSRLDLSNGLSNNQVNTIYKDSQGYMWFGTVAGLNRYDGYQFKVFKHNARDPKSLSDDFINGISELPDDKLLIDTRAGLNIFDLEKQQFDHDIVAFFKNLGIPITTIIGVKKDKSGNFWFNAGADGVFVYNLPKKRTVHLKCADYVPNALGSAPVTHIQSDAKGDMYVLHTDKSFERFDISNLKVKTRYHNLKVKDKTAFKRLRFFIDNSGAVFIWSFNGQEGLTYYQPALKEVKYLSQKAGGLNNNLVTGVIQDENGNIWIGTDHGGINILNKKTLKIDYVQNREDDPKTLSQNSVVSLYKDNAGIIWVGTFKKGISYYHKNIIKFPLFRHLASDSGSLPYDDINRFVEDERGNLLQPKNTDI